MYEPSLKGRIDELENTNEFLRNQLMEKDKLLLGLRKLVKGSRDSGELKLRIPGEKENEVDALQNRLSLLGTDSRFEVEYMNALDEIRIKSIALEELKKTLVSEREARSEVIQKIQEASIAKDVEVQNLRNALEKAYKRTCELEDQLSKAKQRGMVHISNSPNPVSATPRVSIGHSHSDQQQRRSYSGPLSSIPPQRASINMSSSVLPLYTIPSNYQSPNMFIHAQYTNRS